MEQQHESDLVKRTRAPGNRSRRIANRNHSHVRADLHEWYHPRRGFTHVSGRGFEQVRGLANMENYKELVGQA